MQAIVFPDIEAWAIGYLDAALDARSEPYAASVFIGNEVPETRRDRMVILRRDGGPRLDLTREAARLTIRVYGRTEKEVSDLAALVRALIGAAADGRPVALVRELAGPTPVRDEAGRPTYRLMSVELTALGVPLS